MRIETGLKVFISMIWICLAACSVLLIWHCWYVYLDYIERQEIELRIIQANRVLEGQELQNCLTRHCPAGGCKNLSSWEDAYDQVFGTDTACAVAIYKTNPFELQKHVLRPRSNVCYRWSQETEMYTQENISAGLAHKLLSRMDMPAIRATGQFLIPKKLNFVWMTSQKAFHTGPEAFVRTNPYIFHNAQATPRWQRTLWINDPNLLTSNVKQQLDANAIIIRSLDELSITNPTHRTLRELALKYAQQGDWGRSSDIARDLIEYYEGGIYVDGDYQLLDIPKLELYMQSYRSFFGTNMAFPHKKIFEVNNAFMASEPHGAIVKRKLELVHRNLLNKRHAPQYIQYPCKRIDAILMQTGPGPLKIAFLQAHNSEDALLPFYSTFPLPLYFPGTWIQIGKDKLGKHDFQSSWWGSRTNMNFVY